MTAQLLRLVRSLAAYQLADVIAKLIAVLLLPVYTHYLSRSAYGVVELLANTVIFVSIVVRFGLIEAFLRYYFLDEDPDRRDRLVRGCVLALAGVTSVAVIPLIVFAGPLSTALLSHRDVPTFLVAVLGLWSFTNLELAYGVLRVDERLAVYARASVANVLLTVTASLVLVVGAREGARGLLLGNYAVTSAVLIALWFSMRRRLLRRVGGRRGDGAGAGAQPLRELLRFGLPTVPAEASVYALSIVDRLYIYHVRSPGQAGLYSIAVKLAGAVTFVVRAFQYAWPPLAYSVASDVEAGRLYGRITTLYVLTVGWIVAGLTLLGRWALRLLTQPQFYAAHGALGWVALGWALYGLWVVFLVIAGRVGATKRNFPASLAGLAVNVVLLLLLVPPLGIAGAGIALSAAYLAMLSVMFILTRGLLAVDFEWRRLAQLIGVLGGVAVAGETLLPPHGVSGFGLRLLAFLAIPALLWALRFPERRELELAARLLRSPGAVLRGARP